MKQKKIIKLFDPLIDESEERAIKRVLKSHFWASGSGQGNVSKFEKKFQTYVNAKDCVAVNSGTAALNLALSIFDLKGKEVILPSLSFVSTAHAVILNGGIPIFADVEPESLCIDPIQIERLISKKTKLILPVHFGGLASNLTKIQKMCKENDIHLVEDAAHATGTTYQNKKIGNHGDLVCFSFHPVKNLAMPTGGLISINSDNHKKITEELKEKRWCGINNRKDTEYDIKNVGWNYYMNEFSAVIGLEQLKKLNKLNNIKKSIAKKYAKKINVENKMSFNKDCSYHLYWILVKNRKMFRKKLKENGIETGTHYRPIHTFTMYNKKKYSLPITEKIAKEIVTIPIHPNLSEQEIDKIIEKVNFYA